MLFNSISFAVFLPIVFSLYWMTKSKYRWLILLLSSYYFYMSWNVKYVFLILGTTIVSYVCSLSLQRTNKKNIRKMIVAISIIFGGSILFFFKYFNFISHSVNNILKIFSINFSPVTLSWLLPVGISFYTFQTISYVLDVYRGDIIAEKNFGKYATFVSFFPQLVAGPIERTSNLLPQIKTEHRFNYEKGSYGLKLMAWGFFKKLIVADGLGLYVDRIYENIYAYNGFALLVATLFFSFQIYCDFSGYSDIAIGCAKLFGINLMTNFKSPYLAISVQDFWRRWHISLSTWFRDYIYIPLGGNRVSKGRYRLNLFVTFLFSGLWHGASWTFIVWGGIHGILQILENIFSIRKPRNRMDCILRIITVFLIINIAWVFFRADTLGGAIYVVKGLTQGIVHPIKYVVDGIIELQIHSNTWIRLIFVVGIVILFDIISVKNNIIECISKFPLILRWGVYIGVVDFIIIYFMKYGVDSNSFVYFQF